MEINRRGCDRNAPLGWSVLSHLLAHATGVDWYNNRRLLEPIGYRTPREAEMEYYQQRTRLAEVAGLTLQPLR